MHHGLLGLRSVLGPLGFVLASSQQAGTPQEIMFELMEKEKQEYEAKPAAGGAGKGKKPPHGNTAGSQLAWLYAKMDQNGHFLKWGVSVDWQTRYSGPELNGGRLVPVGRGPRDEILWIERALVEKYPGPENKEPWAG